MGQSPSAELSWWRDSQVLWKLKFITEFTKVPRLRLTLCLLPLCTFMVWTGKNFTFYHNLSLSWGRLIQLTQSHPIFVKSILISFQFMPRFSCWSSGFRTETLYAFTYSPVRAECPTHHILLDLIARITLGEYTSWSSSIRSFLQAPVTSYLWKPNVFFSPPVLKTFNIPFMWETKFNIQTKQQTKLQFFTF